MPTLRISSLTLEEFRRCLRTSGIVLRVGPFLVRVQSGLEDFAGSLHELYSAFSLDTETVFADFHIQIAPPGGVRKWVRPQVRFILDGSVPFSPLPARLALPLFEWCLNWTIAKYANQFLIIHSAVLAKDGHALMLSAPPGSGKSTLCAALTACGWRLLSDELALIRPEDGRIVPMPRPISLKNESIREIARFSPEAKFGRIFKDTHKGTIAHLLPASDSVARSGETAQPAWVVFPTFKPGQSAALRAVTQGHSLLRVADNSFNYNVLGEKGFETLAAVADRVRSYELTYGDLGDAVAKLIDVLPNTDQVAVF